MQNKNSCKSKYNKIVTELIDLIEKIAYFINLSYY